MTKEELLQTYFYIEDISGSTNTVSITKNNSSAPTLTIEYSTDGVTWTTKTMNSDTTANTFTIPANGKLYLRGVNPVWGKSNYYNTITCSGQHNVGGNIMSLLYGSEFKNKTEFPATNSRVLFSLFKNNINLVNAKDLQLPATTLAADCYWSMFYGCSSLTTAPELPATTLAEACYSYMFGGCTSLTTAPSVLPATTLANNCYSSMFRGCSSLTTAPELPATTLAEACYNQMFNGCSSLTTAPELPATTLAQNCYYGMFSDCTSLTTAPELPATKLATGCYNSMFSGCSSLNYIKAYFINYDSNYFSNWVYGVSSTGTFVMHPNATYNPDNIRGINGIPTGWNVKKDVIQIPNYFYIEDISGSENTVTIQKSNSSAPTLKLEYSTDGSTWTTKTMNSNTTANTFTIPANGKLYLRGVNERWGGDEYFYNNKIYGSGQHNVGGNIMSLLYGSDFIGKTTFPTTNSYVLNSLFYNNTNLVNVKDLILPATTLVEGCYKFMFYGCTSLTTAPELPATTLAMQCYSGMFQNCSNLTTVPSILPAPTLAVQCYQEMFYGCTSLTTAPELPATTLAMQCYFKMFNGCKNLTTVPSILPATTLDMGCYQEMFYNCTSLTTTPELPATTLTLECYNKMFYGCKNLTTVPSILPATTLANYCYQLMFYGCTSLTTAPELPATTLANYCYSGMFQNCSNLTTAPELPATTLAVQCYKQMFQYCSKLNYIKANFIEYNNSQSQFSNWVQGVSSTGTFVMNPEANYKPEEIRGVNGIPSGWNVVLPPLTYCYIQTIESNTLIIQYQNDNVNLEYSFGDDIWKSINHTTNIEFIDVIYLRGNNTSLDGVRIKTSKESTLNGNIMALLYGDNYEDMVAFPEGSKNTFKYLFLGYDKCLDITNLLLPATELAPNCYHHMFTGCTKLKSIPELPADNLTNYCYHGMFMDCDGIDKATLSAQYLAPYAYSNMFLGSDNLNEVTTNFIEFDETSLKGWLKDVNPEGNLYLSKEYPYDIEETKDILYVPDGWDIN